VLIGVTTTARAQAVVDIVGGLPDPASNLFVVSLLADSVDTTGRQPDRGAGGVHQQQHPSRGQRLQVGVDDG